MALTDIAEYWNDVKAHRVYLGPTFRHHPRYKCSHVNPHTGNTERTPYVDDINCYECKEYIAQHGTDGLKEGKAPIDYYMTKGAAKKHRRHQKELQAFDALYGRCVCGDRLVIKKNRKTGEKFLGCSSYPKCTHTKTL